MTPLPESFGGIHVRTMSHIPHLFNFFDIHSRCLHVAFNLFQCHAEKLFPKKPSMPKNGTSQPRTDSKAITSYPCCTSLCYSNNENKREQKYTQHNRLVLSALVMEKCTKPPM